MKLPAKKSLGQHFLNSKHVLGQIIEAAKIKPGDKILEIGPGTGVLTEALLQAGANVLAVEKDDRAFALLKEKFSQELGRGQLTLLHDDILLMNFGSKSEEFSISNSQFSNNYSIVANIPYYITGAILEKFLEHEPRPQKMILLVQREVAERIVARDGKHSILSVSVQAFGKPSIIARVPPGAFTPPPTVESAILAIDSISGAAFQAKNLDSTRFFGIVRAAFAHKRKYAIRNLETILDPEKLQKIWQILNLDPKIRAEDIPVTTWVEIAAQ